MSASPRFAKPPPQSGGRQLTSRSNTVSKQSDDQEKSTSPATTAKDSPANGPAEKKLSKSSSSNPPSAPPPGDTDSEDGDDSEESSEDDEYGGGNLPPLPTFVAPPPPASPPPDEDASDEGASSQTLPVLSPTPTASHSHDNLAAPPPDIRTSGRSDRTSSSRLMGGTIKRGSLPRRASRPQLRENYDVAVVRDLFASPKKVDRSSWAARLSMEHPEIQELRERVHPLDRAVAFGLSYDNNRMAKMYSNKRVLELIMQHLGNEGLRNSCKVMAEETRIKDSGPQNLLEDSRLLSLVRAAVKDVDHLWGLVIGDRSLDDEKTLQDIEDQLYHFDMLEEEDLLVDDVNIYEEEKEGNILFTENKDIKAASLNQLVEKLTLPTNHDLTFQKTFLMTYQSFTKAEILMMKLQQRYHVPAQKDDKMDEKDYQSRVVLPIRLRVCNTLKKWLEDHSMDFNETRLQNLKMFVENTVAHDHPSLATSVSKAMEKAATRREEGTKPQVEIIFSFPPPPPVVPKNIFSKSLSLFDVDELEIARQLTLMEFDLYYAIQPQEFLDQSWAKAKLKHRARNLLEMIQRFNDISVWTATTILKTEKIRQRNRVMQKFIGIVEHLRQLNNFNTAMAVLAGLNNASVHRLKYTWADLSNHHQKVYNEIGVELSSNNAYKSYRNLLGSVNPPLIPYLGVYLTDLTFIDDGNPNFTRTQDGKLLINLGKRQLTYRVVAQIQQYQQKPYNLTPIHQIQQLLQSSRFAMLPEEDLYRLSLSREPRKAERSEIA